MHGRVPDLPKIGLRQHRHIVVVFLLAFVGSLLFSSFAAEAKSDYEIINTGIKASGCWYDNTRYVALQGHSELSSQSFVVEGLFYLDVNNPRELKVISLSPLDQTAVSRIYRIKCVNKTIVFSTKNQVYGVRIGEAPELIAERLGGAILPEYVNIDAKYVLGTRGKLSEGDTGISLSPESALKDCHFKYLKAGFHARCGNFHLRGLPHLLPHFVFAEYYWSETLLVKGEGGKDKRISNPEPPLKLADGTELKHGYLLRDLDSHLIQQIKLEQPPYQIYRIPLKLDPQGEYLYANCSKAGDHGNKPLTVGGRVCRYKLDGNNRAWEEVFAVQQSPKDPFSLQDLDVNGQGDVVVVDRGHRLNQSIWKYTVNSRTVELVTRAPLDLGGPLLSPDGWWISFVLRNELYFARHKGERP